MLRKNVSSSDQSIPQKCSTRVANSVVSSKGVATLERLPAVWIVHVLDRSQCYVHKAVSPVVSHQEDQAVYGESYPSSDALCSYSR